MYSTIEFTKMSGAGNDFVVIDNRSGSILGDKAAFAREVCSRHFGIGADGLLLVEKSSVADFAMGYYNADGSYGGMCGNGGRCISRYAFRRGIAQLKMSFEALGYTYRAEVIDPLVRLQMKPIRSVRQNVLLALSSGVIVAVSYVDTGAPHVVIESKDLKSVNVSGVGREIRYMISEFPAGTNVNFVEQVSASSIKMRTYERGVEAETLACGTGAVASAAVSSVLHGLKPPITIHVSSEEQLVVHFRRHDAEFVDVLLEGSAHFLFTGQIAYDHDSCKIVDLYSLQNSSET